jgi:hypothetical protein
MQTGCEDWPDYVVAGVAEDRRRIIDEVNTRFAEAPPADQEMVWSIAPRFGWDTRMIWTAASIAHFMGGTHGKRTEETRTTQGD